MSQDLTPEKALIFRIVHRDNIAALFRHGLHSSGSTAATGPYTRIGNLELIDKRKGRDVRCPPGGTLPDYVPFYFTPFTPMMYNIKTGYGGVKQEASEDIIILVSSLHKLATHSIPFVFTDRHAYLKLAQFTNDMNDINWIDWQILQARNFRKDDIERFERYQAEALVYRHVPITALLGVVCYNPRVKQEVEACASTVGIQVQVIAKPGWYL